MRRTSASEIQIKDPRAWTRIQDGRALLASIQIVEPYSRVGLRSVGRIPALPFTSMLTKRIELLKASDESG
jgi:hypothetical protein